MRLQIALKRWKNNVPLLWKDDGRGLHGEQRKSPKKAFR